MAKVTVTIEDDFDERTVHMKFEFEPALDLKNNPQATPAQTMGFQLSEIATSGRLAELVDVDGTPSKEINDGG